jgi:hypothetical protein
MQRWPLRYISTIERGYLALVTLERTSLPCFVADVGCRA